MAAIDGEDFLWAGLFWRATGDADSGLERTLAALLVQHFTLDQEHLANLREVEIGVEGIAAPNSPSLDPTMVRWRNRHEVCALPILEEERDIGLQCRLIAFDREVIVRLALHQVGRQLALCQQRVGGDVLALNIDRIEQGHEHPDFIGLLELVPAIYGQGADFFWVWHTPV